MEKKKIDKCSYVAKGKGVLKGRKRRIFGKEKNVVFSVTGKIEGYAETVKYEYKRGIGAAKCGKMSEFLLRNALERETLVGPVGQYMNRDINVPLAMLSILISEEIFDEIIEVKRISGKMPEAASIPKGAIG